MPYFSWADVVSPVVSTTCKRLVSWVMQGGSRSSSNSSGSSSQSSGSGSSSSSSSDGRFSKDSNLRRAPLVMLRGCALLLALVLVRALAVTAPLPAVATAAAAAAAAVGGSLPTTSPAPTMNQKPAIAHPSLGSEGGKQEPKKDQRQHLNRWRRMLFVLLHLDLLLLAILAVRAMCALSVHVQSSLNYIICTPLNFPVRDIFLCPPNPLIFIPGKGHARQRFGLIERPRRWCLRIGQCCRKHLRSIGQR